MPTLLNPRLTSLFSPEKEERRQKGVTKYLMENCCVSLSLYLLENLKDLVSSYKLLLILLQYYQIGFSSFPAEAPARMEAAAAATVKERRKRKEEAAYRAAL